MTDAAHLFGRSLPRMTSAGPNGPRTRALVDTLARYECPGLTARRRRREELSGAPHDPIVWARASGGNVEDADGNVYVDLTGGFGVALLGHALPTVVAAVQSQAGRLLHALGDVSPSREKIALEAALAALVPWPARVILGVSGADAVEAALKTARLATGRAGIVAFEGGYHGLSYGALAACGYREAFRAPFAGQLNPSVRFVPYPSAESAERSLSSLREALADGSVGAVLLEPVLGRGGVVVAPDAALRAVAAATREAGALFLADEIYTGLRRTGPWFRSVAAGCEPDVVVTGKALGGGLPVSAAIVREDVAQAWGDCAGEAIHTSTFLGNPMAAAAALAVLEALHGSDAESALAGCAANFAAALDAPLRGVRSVVTAGLLLGVALDGGSRRALAVCRTLLEAGYIVLTGGAAGDVLTLTPPACLTSAQIDAFVAALRDALDRS